MANLTGHVRLHKSIRRNPVWRREPFTYGQAFADLLLLAVDAQSAPQQVWVQGEQIELERGQVGWSISKLAEEWQRTREWVSAFLKWLAGRGMVRVDSNHRRTIITITNYDAYQATDPTTDLAAGQATDPTTEPPHKGKGERGNGKGETGNHKGKGPGGSPPTEREKNFPELPGDDVLAAWFAGFADPARGVAGIPEVWWRGWVSSRLNAQRWPADWQGAARMAFLADFADRHPKALGRGGGVKKMAEKKAGGPDGRTAAQARFEISRDLAEVRERLDAAYETSVEPAPADVKREKELERQLKDLES